MSKLYRFLQALPRFHEKVDRYGPDKNGQSRCHIWTGFLDKDGYGTFYFTNKNWRAARFILSWGGLKLPVENLLVCHTCDNPSCVNLDHLFWGTPKENTSDCLEKGRMPGPRKVTKETVLQACRDYSTRAAAAKSLGISVSSLYNYLPKDMKRDGYYAKGCNHWNYRGD